MIRFVDINTGNVFDGSSPYVTWFDGEQSINIMYSKSICFISHKQEHSITIEDNEIFHLINIQSIKNQNIEINGFNYSDINKSKTTNIVSIGTPYHNYFVHIIYILASAKHAGEYKCNFQIEGENFLIGADFYDIEESSYINLSNQGAEIPESIQKALYPANVHEDKRDNILINRKWKELLSNFWDIMANKGSYKSLYNSLKWFEYGELVKLCEVWKFDNEFLPKYSTQEIHEDLSSRYMDIFRGFAKTTYMSLYLALDKIVVKDDKVLYDSEKNPILEKISTDWTTNDLALKMCMLGNFYQTYFMPIHLDLMHATIENIVFTNTIKSIFSPIRDRVDFIYNVEDIDCNIQNGSIFRLQPVECYVGPNTLFGTQYKDHENVTILGVQRQIPELAESDIKTFTSQMYKEIGVILDFEIKVPLLDEHDFIKREIITTKGIYNGEEVYRTMVDHKPLYDENVKFSLLYKFEGEYEIRLQFDTASGASFTKNIKFAIIDTEHSTIKICKVLNNSTPRLTIESIGINDYMFNRQRNAIVNNYSQYIPAKFVDPEKNYWEGSCLNHLIIYEGKVFKTVYLVFNYDVFERVVNTPTGQKIYSICISRKFGFTPESFAMPYNKVYRDDYIFIPEYHRLEELGDDSTSIDKFIVTDDDTLCVIPDLTYGKFIKDYEWEFVNVSKVNQKPINPAISIKEPFIASKHKEYMDPGYYNVIFRYRLAGDDQINEIRLDSAFIKR